MLTVSSPRYLLTTVLPICGTVVALATVLDSWCHGAWTITPLNFLRFNLLEVGTSSLLPPSPLPPCDPDPTVPSLSPHAT